MKEQLKSFFVWMIASTGGMVAGNMLNMFAKTWVLLTITGGVAVFIAAALIRLIILVRRAEKQSRELEKVYRDEISRGN